MHIQQKNVKWNKQQRLYVKKKPTFVSIFYIYGSKGLGLLGCYFSDLKLLYYLCLIFQFKTSCFPAKNVLSLKDSAVWIRIIVYGVATKSMCCFIDFSMLKLINMDTIVSSKFTMNLKTKINKKYIF